MERSARNPQHKYCAEYESPDVLRASNEDVAPAVDERDNRFRRDVLRQICSLFALVAGQNAKRKRQSSAVSKRQSSDAKSHPQQSAQR